MKVERALINPTVEDLKESLNEFSDDFIVCVQDHTSGEILTVERLIAKIATYFDADGNEKEGNVLIISL